MEIFFTKNKAKILNVTTTNAVVKQVVSLRTSCTALCWYVNDEDDGNTYQFRKRKHVEKNQYPQCVFALAYLTHPMVVCLACTTHHRRNVIESKDMRSDEPRLCFLLHRMECV